MIEGPNPSASRDALVCAAPMKVIKAPDSVNASSFSVCWIVLSAISDGDKSGNSPPSIAVIRCIEWANQKLCGQRNVTSENRVSKCLEDSVSGVSGSRNVWLNSGLSWFWGVGMGVHICNTCQKKDCDGDA
jgi:hypothetical protein